MTMWKPVLAKDGSPLYLAFADVLSRDIENGRLKPGARLPTHRELAQTLGVTIGTITRGYEEARRRGLVTGEVGRGTFVRGARLDVPFHQHDHSRNGMIDLSANHPVLAAAEAELIAAFRSLGPELTTLLEYQPFAGAPAHRQAGAAWIAQRGLVAPPEEIIVTSGAQHGMMITFAAMLKPGDIVLTEAVTYQGMKALARLLGLRLEGVALDEEGLIPAELEAACRRWRPRALYSTPTVQNPTGRLMSARRREEVAAILKAHHVMLVEDDIYGFLVERAPPPLSTLIPEAGYYITSLSKSIAPGLRIGYLKAPSSSLKTLAAAMMTTSIMASPVAAEVASRLIAGGEAQAIVKRRRVEAAERRRAADRILGPHVAEGNVEGANFVWLRLPEPWRVEEFVAQARARGVAVASAEGFAVGRDPAPHAVRVSLCSTADLATLEKGLRVLAAILEGAPVPAMTGM